MAKLLITSAAEGDFAEAVAWYVQRSMQAAERFDAELSQVGQAPMS